jgi:hypothetical protein
VIYTACYAHSEYIALTISEYCEAYQCGKRIWRSSQNRHLTEKAICKDGCHIQGIGEVATRACAKLLGLPWLDTMDSFKGADLGYNIEVRCLGREWYGCRIRDDDHDSRRVVAVIIPPGRELEEYRFPGWINARHAKQPEWQIDPRNLGRPMYAVPQEKLYPMAELRRILKKPC